MADAPNKKRPIPKGTGLHSRGATLFGPCANPPTDPRDRNKKTAMRTLSQADVVPASHSVGTVLPQTQDDTPTL